MIMEIGQEFERCMDGYRPVEAGKGTHIWNGSKIVLKRSEREYRAELAAFTATGASIYVCIALALKVFGVA